MNIITIIFWIGLGILYTFGALFSVHELLVGLCALVIGIAQLINETRRA
jgi:hypothetical protein